jgi:hypothetical protein
VFTSSIPQIFYSCLFALIVPSSSVPQFLSSAPIFSVLFHFLRFCSVPLFLLSSSVPSQFSVPDQFLSRCSGSTFLLSSSVLTCSYLIHSSV